MHYRTNAEALAAFRQYSMPNYDPAPVAFERGQGARLWDVEGKAYIDFAGGVAVASLGHGHAAWATAVAQQAQRLTHTSNLYVVENQVRLAKELVTRSGLSKAFFCNSGTEALEAALKLARKWGSKNGGRYELVATHHAFHGRTMGALTLTGTPKYQHGFEPLVPGVHHVPYGDVEALTAALGPKTAAVVLEPIQGEGGVQVPSDDYLRRVRHACDQAGVLLILDEVQTGIGRVGDWFAFQSSGIRPDILCLAKGLGGGFPIGAVLCNERANAFEPGNHGSTFGGNPLACAAALATLEHLESQRVLDNVRRQGQAILARLAQWQREGWIQHVRGKGLLLGFDLARGDSKSLARELLARGLLVSNLANATVRLCPPLVLTDQERQEGLGILERALRATIVAAPA